MRAAGLLLFAALPVVVAVGLGCDAELTDLASRVVPVTAERQAEILTRRYMAGDYPGTINHTLDDPVVVYHFTYQNGVTLWALTLLHEHTGDADLLRQVQTSLAKYDRDRLYRPELGEDPIDYLGSMAHATLAYSLTSGDERYLENALSAARFFRDDVARTPKGLIAYHSDPQRGRIWADALFMVTPLMAKAGRLLDDPAYYDDVLAQFRGFTQKLRDPDVGLYHQGWNWHGSGASPGYWGRANGWVALAMTEVLGAIPEGHAGRDELLGLYRDFMAAVVAHQGHNGMWHQLLNRPDTYEETSCSGMFIYALSRGVQRGWLPGQYADAVRRGHAGLSRMMSLEGEIENICPGTPTQASEEAYARRSLRRNDSHGIGPAMLGVYGALTLPD